jgi:Family of unknown function (DUF5906)
MSSPFANLADERRWIAWRNERRGERFTKVPYGAGGKPAKADDPATWLTRSQAEQLRRRLANGVPSGIGWELGPCDTDLAIGGVDLDTCLDPSSGAVEPWAQAVIHRFHSYAETSPSQRGVKVFFYYPADELDVLRAAMDGRDGRKYATASRGDHPPAIELYLNRRYFAVTEQHFAGSPEILQMVSTEDLLWLIHSAGPAFAGTATNQNRNTVADGSRSAVAFRKGAAHRRAGDTFEEMVAALRADPETADWVREKGEAAGGRELKRIWEKAGIPREGVGVSLDDFYAYMPLHNYIFAPSREVWPAVSVNARIPSIQVGTDDEGEPISIKASHWLDQNNPVEQMTWAPGLPTIIKDRLISEGGWIKRTGVACFNLYRPPTIRLGDPAEAGPWLDHVNKIYPNDAPHIIRWLAHRVQRPADKINHALMLGGPQGIGKDSLLEPVKRAVGPWNVAEPSPAQQMGRFNGFAKSVILRINEAHDLGDLNRYQFYEHLKIYTASPPDVLRVDEKNLREHNVLNCCGVIITTNHETDGLYLPADDRRHYVAWSSLTKDHFAETYWNKLWSWYDNGGDCHVAAFLAKLDLGTFNPKAPPQKTEAFWAIVNAGRNPEDAELADCLDHLNNPDATTSAEVLRAAENLFPPPPPVMPGAALPKSDSFVDWLKDRRNRRAIPHRFEACGYVAIRNPDAADGLWRIRGKRTVIYAKESLTLHGQIAAARALR